MVSFTNSWLKWGLIFGSAWFTLPTSKSFESWMKIKFKASTFKCLSSFSCGGTYRDALFNRIEWPTWDQCIRATDTLLTLRVVAKMASIALAASASNMRSSLEEWKIRQLTGLWELYFINLSIERKILLLLFLMLLVFGVIVYRNLAGGGGGGQWEWPVNTSVLAWICLFVFFFFFSLLGQIMSIYSTYFPNIRQLLYVLLSYIF